VFSQHTRQPSVGIALGGNGGAAAPSKRYTERAAATHAQGRRVVARVRGIGHTAGRQLRRGPTGRKLGIGTVIRFGLGLLGFVGVITWQMGSIACAILLESNLLPVNRSCITLLG
jgi:hypothetical protein